MSAVSISKGSILLADLLFNATRLSSSISEKNVTTGIESRSPAIIVMHPAGGVKEQIATICAEKLSQNGFVTLAYDASYQDESGGLPHFLEDLSERPSDVSSVVDYLARQDFVDPERIAVLVICGGGGYAAAATLRDHRIKALATVSMVNNGAATHMGWYETDDASAMLEPLEAAATQLAAGAEVVYQQCFPDPVTNGTPYDLVQANEHYLTPRGQYPTSKKIMVSESLPSILGFDAFLGADSYLTQPTLLIAGADVDSLWHTVRLDKMIGGAIKSLIVPRTTHVGFYDRMEYIDPAVEDALDFFRENLA